MTAFSQLAPIATVALFSAVWQSGLLVLCVATLLWLLPGVTAAARSLTWAAVFLLTLVLPFAHLASPSSAGDPGSAGLHLDVKWAMGVAILWAALSILRAVRLLQSAIRLLRVASHSTPVEPTSDIADLLAAPEPKVRLCTSSDVDTPSVVGFFHRCILLPPGFAEGIAHADLYRIVLHELEHLRRRDDWTNLLQKLGLVVFPLHPALLWVDRRMSLERELACDDGVLRATGGAAKAYATCLANLAEASFLQRRVSLALGAWRRRSELAGRVHRILQNPVRQMKPANRMVLATLFLSATVGLGVLAARSPQLITFSAASSSPFNVEAAAILPRSLPPREGLVRASLAEPRVATVALHTPPRRVHHHRTVGAGMRQTSSTRNFVLIRWQPDQLRGCRQTTIVQSFQLVYAAVPTRTGWLFFQL